MTNREYMLHQSADDCCLIMDWVWHEYGRRDINTPLAVRDWLEREAITGEWQKVPGYVTAGGDPVYACPNCGQDEHIYGIEHPSERRKFCRWCGCFNTYPMR